MARLPFNLAKSLNAFKEVSAGADESASIILAGDPGLVERAKERFSAGGTVPSSYVGSLSQAPGITLERGEVLVVLATPAMEQEVRASLAGVSGKGSVIVAVDEGPGTRIRASYLAKDMLRLSFLDSPAGWARLFSLCAEAVGDRGVALARRYPLVRRAAAHRLIARTSAQNVFIALLFFIPGSDMPAMTLNQAKMVLNVAAMHGQPIDKERAVELVAVLALGFGFRGVGRSLVRAVPGLALLLRMVTAYTATTAVGLGAIAYFENGAPASTSKVIDLAKSMRR